MSTGRPHILIVGCGYLGRRLAVRLRDRYEVSALIRSQAKATALQQLGIAVEVLDLDRVSARRPIPERLEQQAIFYLAPPSEDGESDLRLDRFLQLVNVPKMAHSAMGLK